ncbi:MAG: CHAT domain-containing protein, partial [Cyanobacteria bacterium J06632_3]
GASTFENQPDLPAVNAEVSLISQQLWEGDSFLNEDFVLETLQTQLKERDYGVLHLATHAVFNSGDLNNSYIQLWDEQLSLSRMTELNLSEAEISLIILSACNTALGDEASEYGFAGFTVSAGSQSALASLWPVNDEGTLGFMSQFYEHLHSTPVRADALRQAQINLIAGNVGIQDGIVYGPNDQALAEIPELADSGNWIFSHPFYWSAFTMIGNPW